MRKLPASAGFALVELMLVVGIMGLLAALAFPAVEIFVRKAKRAEAFTLIHHITSSVEAWKADHDNKVVTFNDGTWGPGSSMGIGGSILRLINNNLTSTSSCNTTNPLGISVSNCLKTNFQYTLYTSYNSQNFATYALSNANFSTVFTERDYWVHCPKSTPGAVTMCNSHDSFSGAMPPACQIFAVLAYCVIDP